LRGRLRREGFTIFKKGSKGISYVCAVKRKFRVPGQVFSDSIGALISFIEVNPMVKASELASKFLGIAPPPASASADGATPAPSGNSVSPVGTPSPKIDPTLTPEQRTKLSRLQGDLAWLVHEGYVTEFIDGRLFAPPAMVEARKKEAESAEHDPENFPDAPLPSEAPMPAAPVAEKPSEVSSPPSRSSPVDGAPADLSIAVTVTETPTPAIEPESESEPDAVPPALS
jgi:hypothetical protein